jgi:drug/metabolite transporter (DMT)-like permease
MAAVPQRKMTPGEWGLPPLLPLLWGGSFFFVGVAVKEPPPLTIAMARISLAAAPLWLTAPLTGLSPGRIRANAPAFAVLGLALVAIGLAFIDGRLPSAFLGRARR